MTKAEKSSQLAYLGWVKDEVFNSLDQSRAALEAHAEHSDESDLTKLERCRELIGQVHGTFQMVQLGGALSLVEEMLRLIDALLADSEKIPDHHQAYQALMHVMLQLPGYFSRVQSGQVDSAVILLPLVNELRQGYGAEATAAEALFAPNISGVLPPELAGVEPYTDGDLAHLIKRTRQQIHLFMLGLFRGENVAESMDKMVRLYERYSVTAQDEIAKQLYWVAAVFCETIRETGADIDGSNVKLLLGQIDRVSKKILDVGESGLLEAPPTELMYALLYHIASSSVESERINAVETAFSLHEYLPPEQELEKLRGELAGPGAEVIETVVQGITQELYRAIDLLDDYNRAEEKDAKKLQELTHSLRNAAGTATMLGDADIQTQMNEYCDKLDQMIGDQGDIGDADLAGIAGFILQMDVRVQSLAPATADGDIIVDADADLPQVQVSGATMHDVRLAVVKESTSNMNLAKDVIAAFVETPDTHRDKLQDASGLLQQVAGSLRVASLNHVSDILYALSAFVDEELIKAQKVLNERETEALVDAVSSVDYYLESFTEDLPNKSIALDMAETALASLGHAIGDLDQALAELASELPDEEHAPDHGPGILIEDESAQLGALADDIWQQSGDDKNAMIDDAPLAAASPGMEVESAEAIADTGFGELSADAPEESEAMLAQIQEHIEQQDVADEIVLETPTVSPEHTGERTMPATAAAADAQESPLDESPLGDDIDEEIVDIFLEEFDEVLIELREHFSIWRDDPDNADSLTVVRRCFHTLKGGARMIGSNRIGDFAWSGENLLNKVIDKSISIVPEIMQFIAQAIEVLPAMSEQLRDHSAPAVDVSELSDMAYVLAQGKPFTAAAPPAVEANVPEEDSAPVEAPMEEVAEVDEPPQVAESVPPIEVTAAELTMSGLLLDSDDIREVYTQETAQLIQDLREFNEGCRASSEPCYFDKAQTRILHTLRAGAATVGAEVIRAPLDLLEPLIIAYRDKHLKVDDALLGLCERVVAQVQLFLDVIGGEKEAFVADANLPEELASFGQQETAPSKAPTDDSPQDSSPDAADDASAGALSDEMLHGINSSLEDLRDLMSSDMEPVDVAIEVPQQDDALDPDSDSDSTQAGDAEVAPPGEAETEASQAEIAEPEPDDMPPTAIPEVMAPGDAEAEAPKAEIAEPEPEPTPFEMTGLVDPEIVDMFLEEAGELLATIEQALDDWQQGKDDKELIIRLQRDLHTLKGGARMVNLNAIGNLGHDFETLLTAVVDGHVEVTRPLIDGMHEVKDELQTLYENACQGNGDSVISKNVSQLLQSFRQGGGDNDKKHEATTTVDFDLGEQLNELATAEDTAVVAVDLPSAVESDDEADKSASAESNSDAPEKTAADSDTPAEQSPDEKDKRANPRIEHETVRVRSDLIDGLVNLAGETNIFRSRLEQQSGSFRSSLSELDQTVLRLQEQLKALDMETEAQILFRHEKESESKIDESFDPLEMDRYSALQQLSRGLVESVDDLKSLQNILTDLTKDSDLLLLQQGRVNSELQDRLMQARVVPFVATVAPRLRRITRQTCRQLDKQAELRIQGSDEGIDRYVLDHMMAPLEHMIRNCVSHGIEAPDVRKAKGKPEVGTITVSVSREGGEIVIRIADDGAGMNTSAIRKKAEEKGIIVENADMTDDEIMQLVLMPGFSTADTVSQISGRGVGMDVVNNEVRRLHGSLYIESVMDCGTAITAQLPFTLSITQALLVGVANNLYAIPLLSVEGVSRISTEQAKQFTDDENDSFLYGGESYHVSSLGKLLGNPTTVSEWKEVKPAIILVRMGGHQIGFYIDELLGHDEIVVKSLGAQVSGVNGMIGGTILGDGRVALILDVPALVRMVGAETGMSEAGQTQLIETPDSVKINVMVVDDSITVRQVTKRLLERNEMDVMTAKDGVDAIAKLEESMPDVMLLDVEMPRMDGFELASHMRGNTRYQDVPIVMITSRTGAKHRERAQAIGVDRYLGKPYQEADLLDNISQAISSRQQH